MNVPNSSWPATLHVWSGNLSSALQIEAIPTFHEDRSKGYSQPWPSRHQSHRQQTNLKRTARAPNWEAAGQGYTQMPRVVIKVTGTKSKGGFTQRRGTYPGLDRCCGGSGGGSRRRCGRPTTGLSPYWAAAETRLVPPVCAGSAYSCTTKRPPQQWIPRLRPHHQPVKQPSPPPPQPPESCHLYSRPLIPQFPPFFWTPAAPTTVGSVIHPSPTHCLPGKTPLLLYQSLNMWSWTVWMLPFLLRSLSNPNYAPHLTSWAIFNFFRPASSVPFHIREEIVSILHTTASVINNLSGPNHRWSKIIELYHILISIWNYGYSGMKWKQVYYLFYVWIKKTTFKKQ